MNQKKLFTLIDKAVRKKHLEPKFYVIGGSHIYGFPSEKGGDTDVRGFHIAKKEDFLKLRLPKSQIIINQGGVTEGFEFMQDIELVSFELRNFGQLLHKMNFNVLEWLFSGIGVINGVPMEINALKEIVTEYLPFDVPRHYLGMARHNYYKFLYTRKESYTPTAKKYLYVLRGLLGAEYVSKEGRIEPDINKLAKHLLEEDGQKIVYQLIQKKKIDETKLANTRLIDKSEKLIAKLFNRMKLKTNRTRELDKKLEKDIDDWMMKLR